jgi:hypothetical protein
MAENIVASYLLLMTTTGLSGECIENINNNCEQI